MYRRLAGLPVGFGEPVAEEAAHQSAQHRGRAEEEPESDVAFLEVAHAVECELREGGEASAEAGHGGEGEDCFGCLAHVCFNYDPGTQPDYQTPESVDDKRRDSDPYAVKPWTQPKVDQESARCAEAA